MKQLTSWMILFFIQSASFAEEQGTNRLAPEIHCENPVLEIGLVINTGRVTHVFEVTNRGLADLVISRVRVGPGLSRDLRFPLTVRPGGNCRVPLTLPLVGRYGKVCRMAEVFSNDPVNPKLKISIEGVATNTVMVHPWHGPNFGSIDPGERVSRSVDVWTDSDQPFSITNVKSDGATTSVEVVEPQKQYRVWISNRKQAAGRINNDVYIYTDHPEMPEHRLRLFGNVR